MLILASQSPRRREILERAGIPFAVRVAGVPEQIQAGETPHQYVRRLAREKACAVPGDLVLGADTVVVLDEHILEKPKDAADAFRMLRMLSGREHSVVTGVCLRRAKRVPGPDARKPGYALSSTDRQRDRGLRRFRRADGQSGRVRDPGTGLEIH